MAEVFTDHHQRSATECRIELNAFAISNTLAIQSNLQRRASVSFQTASEVALVTTSTVH